MNAQQSSVGGDNRLPEAAPPPEGYEPVKAPPGASSGPPTVHHNVVSGNAGDDEDGWKAALRGKLDWLSGRRPAVQKPNVKINFASVPGNLRHWIGLAVLYTIGLIVKLLSKPSWLHFGAYRLPPTIGWRRWVYGWSEGRWNFGNSIRRRRQVASTTNKERRYRKGIVVDVSAPTGGEGKTTGAIKIAQVYREENPYATVALVDINPNPGTLGDRTEVIPEEHVQAVIDGKPEEACLTVEDVWAHLGDLGGFPDVAWRFALKEEQGIFILVGYLPDGEDARFENFDYTKVMEKLTELFSLVVLDCGTNPWESTAQAILSTADVHVVVVTPRRDRLRIVARWFGLIQRKRYKAGSRIVLVINRTFLNIGNWRTKRAMRVINQQLAEENDKRAHGEAKVVNFSNRVCNMPTSFRLRAEKEVIPGKGGPWSETHWLEIVAAVMTVVKEHRVDEAERRRPRLVR